MTTNPNVDFYFSKAGPWQQELKHLRTIVMDCGLTEQLKWGSPCYTCPIVLTGKKPKETNIVLIHTFKEYCALLFFKGALLKDADGILVQASENVQAARQVRFTSPKQITQQKAALKAYIHEAMAVEKAGLKVEMKKTEAFPMPDEFQQVLAKQPALKKAFHALTPGRQRGYLLHFAAPKQSSTRQSRIEKATPLILVGKGLND